MFVNLYEVNEHNLHIHNLKSKYQIMIYGLKI